MIGLLPITRVIATIAVSYTVIILIAVEVATARSETNNLAQNIRIAVGGSTALTIALLFVVYIGWKWIWKKFPILNTLLFPNLEGNWNMIINFVNNGIPGNVTATARIKQDFLKLSMEVESSGSDSRTLLAQPMKDPQSGRPFLYYMYEVEPKGIARNTISPYSGTAVLRYSTEPVDRLTGNYYTSVGTHGHFALTRA